MNAIERYEKAVKSGDELSQAEFSKLWKAAYKQQHRKGTTMAVWYILGASLVISLIQAIR